MSYPLDTLPGVCELRIGLPRPDWAGIWDWVDAHVADEDLDSAWTAIARLWLQKLKDALPIGYEISESDRFCLLSRSRNPSPETVLSWCEWFRSALLERLPGVAQDRAVGKYVVLSFDDQDTYYSYIADFFPDAGEFGGFGGVFLAEGYSHFAFWTATPFGLDRVVLHELTHSMLSHLPLPLWLNEGVTQMLEDVILESSSFTINRALVQRHREFWSREQIDAFWRGDEFSFPDEAQELSYHLAQVLIRNLCSDFPKQMLTFLRAADLKDAGDSAARTAFGVGLADRVAQFLGPGDWQPRADYDETAPENQKRDDL